MSAMNAGEAGASRARGHPIGFWKVDRADDRQEDNMHIKDMIADKAKKDGQYAIAYALLEIADQQW
jgi:hypothetical protein